MKYKSELIKDIVDTRGHEKSSLHYESECIEAWIEETKGAYPKLCDYESEWLNYMVVNEIGKFPYETVTANPTATINNVVPYTYKSAILKGQTLVNVGDMYHKVNNVLQKIDDTGFVTLIHKSNENYKSVGFLNNGMLKPNTKYLILIDIKENTLECETQVSNSSSLYAFAETGSQYNFPIKAKQTGLIKLIRTTKNDLSNIVQYFYLTPAFNNIGDGSQSITLRMQMIEYVDSMENWDIPYFTGMQSVKLPVLTTSNEAGTKTNILTVNEDVTLRGIGNVRDTLDCLTSEVVQNIGEIMLNGSNYDFTINNNNNTDTIHLIFNTQSLGIKKSGLCVCDKLPYKIGSEDMEHIRINAGGGIVLWFNKSKFQEINKSFIQTYLFQNPVRVQYELAEKSIKTVDLTVVNQDNETLDKIKPHEGTMNINVTGNPINPIGVFEIPVEAITQNLSSFIREE